EISLRPKCLDLQRTMNREAHRTCSYEIPNLILRRGQTFDMSIAFDRVFSEQDDTFTLQFVTGRTMSTSHASIFSSEY
uniref:Transglutaminase N-terminal domain-containing protein n=1 Tax=Magallana gigas TaxID=29159 RepID=A0A8W8K0X3_MAGGI